jgi:16S rRNA C967 or C1407 C5-methylase (RsmB/RsmF family)/NOL1/NOP2/fmu family ribosome biogenesis protein
MTRAGAHPAAPIPPAFADRMARLLGDEYDPFIASIDRAASGGLRTNPLKTTAERLRSLLPFPLTPIPGLQDAFLLSDSGPHEGAVATPGKHAYHAAGLYYLQDPSAMVAVELLDPQPGERILDLAAAPGGKATAIASKLRGAGLLVANEVHGKRAWELAGNLERWGARNAIVANETPARLAARWPGYFDRVLVDAPCSGEGMFRKGDAARLEWTPGLVRGCAARQDEILDLAARLARPGGTLVYATCTFAPEENEGSVARFLAHHPEWELAAAHGPDWASSGRPEWVPDDPLPELASTVRLWPHLGPGDGHFVALLRCGEGAAGAGPADARRDERRPARPPYLDRRARAAYDAFCAEALTVPPAPDGSLSLAGSYLYAAPGAAPDLSGLRVLHPGWWLGTVRGDRFEPSHALALGMDPATARVRLALRADDPEVAAYLRGEGWRPDPGAGWDPGEGWVLVTVGGFALGWARVTAGRVRSMYPKGLRWT